MESRTEKRLKIAVLALLVMLIIVLALIAVELLQPMLNAPPPEQTAELAWTVNLDMIPEHVRNDPGFSVTNEGNVTVIQLSNVSLTENETICIILETPAFSYAYGPPTANGTRITFETEADPRYAYNAASVTTSKYNIEVTLTNPNQTLSIWDAEWQLQRVTYLSRGYNPSMLLTPIYLTPPETRLIPAKQTYATTLVPDLYWAYRMGYVNANGGIDAEGLSEALFPQPGNYTFKQYIYIAPQTTSGTPQPVTFQAKTHPIRITLQP